MPGHETRIIGRDETTNQPQVAEFTSTRLKVDASVSSHSWSVRYEDDESLNDNDKTFTVTAGMVWHLLAARVEFTSDATVGNRQLELRILDAANDTQWSVVPDLVQAASLTYNYNFGPSMSDLDAVRDTTWVSTPFPPTLILPAGSQINIFDNNNVAAGDDMIVHLLIAERAA